MNAVYFWSNGFPSYNDRMNAMQAHVEEGFADERTNDLELVPNVPKGWERIEADNALRFDVDTGYRYGPDKGHLSPLGHGHGIK